MGNVDRECFDSAEDRDDGAMLPFGDPQRERVRSHGHSIDRLEPICKPERAVLLDIRPAFPWRPDVPTRELLHDPIEGVVHSIGRPRHDSGRNPEGPSSVQNVGLQRSFTRQYHAAIIRRGMPVTVERAIEPVGSHEQIGDWESPMVGSSANIRRGRMSATSGGGGGGRIPRSARLLDSPHRLCRYDAAVAILRPLVVVLRALLEVGHAAETRQ